MGGQGLRLDQKSRNKQETSNLPIKT